MPKLVKQIKCLSAFYVSKKDDNMDRNNARAAAEVAKRCKVEVLLYNFLRVREFRYQNVLENVSTDLATLQLALVAAPPMCPLHVWRGEWRQRRELVLEIMSHTHDSTITNCFWAIGISLPSQKKS